MDDVLCVVWSRAEE